MGAWYTASFVALALLVGLAFLFNSALNIPLPLAVVLAVFLPLAMAGYVILIGYIYGDARRRGMRYVVWTLLAIFIPNCIGILLYFLMRDPHPAYCSRCGGTMLANHAFCPHCGYSVAALCGGCQRVTQPGWTHCAWCGASLSAAPDKSSAPPAGSIG
jgi:hypothetical protein